MKRGNKKHKGFSWNRSVLLWTGITILLAITIPCVYVYNRDKGSATEEKISHEENRRVHADLDKRIDHTGGEKRKIAIIIDDVGYELWPINEILKINASITLAILPHCPYSTESAQRAYSAGKEVMLHLPMEPKNYPDKNPGDGALFLHMNDQEIRQCIEKDLQSVPHVSGVNNHMGSSFMENEEKLEVVLKELKRRNLFFVDSQTTRNTKGKSVARKTGVRFIERDVFIDNNCDYTDTLEILKKAIDKSRQWHSLVIIGHPYKSTIRAIQEAVPLMKTKGIAIVPLSDLIT